METNNSLFIWRLYPKAWNVLQQFSVASWADVSHSRLLTLLLKWTIKRVFGKMSFVETRVKEGWTSSIRFQRKAERTGDTVASLSARGSGLQQKLLIRVCLLWWALVMIIIITPEMLIIIFRQFLKQYCIIFSPIWQQHRSWWIRRQMKYWGCCCPQNIPINRVSEFYNVYIILAGKHTPWERTNSWRIISSHWI